MARTSLLFITMLACAMQLAASFTQPVQIARSVSAFKAVPATFLAAKKKKSDFDLSSIESRDLTREEMLDINKQNEEIMNMDGGIHTHSIPQLHDHEMICLYWH